MKLLTPVALLVALQLCAPAAQVERKPSKVATPATKVAGAPERTVGYIDPGHPSEVASGKNVQNGTSETHVDWAVAEKLRGLLEEKAYEVVMTKEREEELGRNRDRALVATTARAALITRLHCDASQERGYAVYYPDRQGRAKDGTVGPSPDVIEQSRRAAGG